MRAVAVVQARMGSTRLPGKVLREVKGISLLDLQMRRLRTCRSLDDVILAIPNTHQDLPLADFANQHNIACYKGSEEDVLGRFYGAVADKGFDLVVRITGDCPLIDPHVVERAINECNRSFDYFSNTQKRSYPRGLDVEVFTVDALTAAFCEAKDPLEREHVTPFLYRHPDRFRLGSFQHSKDHSDHRWTVDTVEDLELVTHLLEGFLPEKPLVGWEEILAVVEQHPEWKALNAGIVQKLC